MLLTHVPVLLMTNRKVVMRFAVPLRNLRSFCSGCYPYFARISGLILLNHHKIPISVHDYYPHRRVPAPRHSNIQGYSVRMWRRHRQNLSTRKHAKNDGSGWSYPLVLTISLLLVNANKPRDLLNLQTPASKRCLCCCLSPGAERKKKNRRRIS